MPIYKLKKSFTQMSQRELIMYVLADSESDAESFVHLSMNDDLPNGLWKNHEEGDDPFDIDNFESETKLVTENDLTNAGLKKQNLINISPILSDMAKT